MKTAPNYDYGPMTVAVNSEGRFIWKTSAGRSNKNHTHTTWRDWIMVKYADTKTKEEVGDIGMIGKIRLPRRYIGKRIRIKIEVME